MSLREELLLVILIVMVGILLFLTVSQYHSRKKERQMSDLLSKQLETIIGGAIGRTGESGLAVSSAVGLQRVAATGDKLVDAVFNLAVTTSAVNRVSAVGQQINALAEKTPEVPPVADPIRTVSEVPEQLASPEPPEKPAAAESTTAHVGPHTQGINRGPTVLDNFREEQRNRRAGG